MLPITITESKEVGFVNPVCANVSSTMNAHTQHQTNLWSTDNFNHTNYEVYVQVGYGHNFCSHNYIWTANG